MYKYSNGLTCKAPAGIVRVYEAIVPVLAAAAAILGSVMLVSRFGNREELFWSIAVVPWICAAWICLCAGVAYVVFVLVCKPVQSH